ncbi:MAG: hypothetical protein ACPLRA_05180 [Candidatus Saccharicenans sp.]
MSLELTVFIASQNIVRPGLEMSGQLWRNMELAGRCGSLMVASDWFIAGMEKRSLIKKSSQPLGSEQTEGREKYSAR